MTTNPYVNAGDQYLTQLVGGASPEKLMALLLEAGQRFLGQSIQAIRANDIEGRSRYVNRVSAIVEELTTRLNFEDGGEVVDNLVRLYDWWTFELMAASTENSVPRLERVSQQMGAMRESWEGLHVKNQCSQPAQGQATLVQGLVG